MADHDNPERSAYNEGYDEGLIDGEERGAQLEERAFQRGHAEERAETQALLREMTQRYENIDRWENGWHSAVGEVQAYLGGEPAPVGARTLTVSDVRSLPQEGSSSSEPSLTVAAIAAHLQARREQLQNDYDAIGGERNLSLTMADISALIAELESVLAWLGQGKANEDRLDVESRYEPAPSGDD